MTSKKLYLKWDNTIIGEINQDNQVEFMGKTDNIICNQIIPKNLHWSSGEFREFLADRIISRNRRDIEKILARLQLVQYDEVEIAKITRAFNLADKFWISLRPNEDYKETFIDIFINVFNNFKIGIGDPTSSPSGQNEKSYAFHDEGFGIVKKRLHPYSTDAESEVIVYRLAKILGVSCCYAEMIDNDRVFSEFNYDFNSQYLIHARTLLKGMTLERQDYRELSKYFSRFKYDIAKMIIIDFITLQDDRHLSNWGVLIDYHGDSRMYDLYDNGRSLLYESTPEIAEYILKDPIKYSNSFGIVGTYYDNIMDIREETKLTQLINININNRQIKNCFIGLKLPKWKVEANIQYINWALKEIERLG